MNKLITISFFLLIGSLSFAQEKSKKEKLPFGESWESDYKVGFDIKDSEYYLYYRSYIGKDTSYRIYSIIVNNDTAEIIIDKLSEITKKTTFIRIGTKLYVPYVKPKTLYKIMW